MRHLIQIVLAVLLFSPIPAMACAMVLANPAVALESQMNQVDDAVPVKIIDMVANARCWNHEMFVIVHR